MDWRLIGSLAMLAGALAGIGVLGVVILRENAAPPARASVKTPLLAAVRTPAVPASLAPAPALLGSPPSQPSAIAPLLGSGLQILDADAPANTGSVSPRIATRPAAKPRLDELRPPPAPAPAPAAKLAPAPPVERFQAAPPPLPRYPAGVLTGAEIARIKARLRLAPDQEPYWRPLEPLLRDIGQQQIANIRAGKGAEINLSSDMTSRLYAAAGPLLNTLRSEQRAEARRLARSMGMTTVASMI